MTIAIVPAYNEAATIASVVQSLAGVVDEVVVVNDASNDTTAATAMRAGATVLTHRINRGQGAALETGHAYARIRGADYVVHFDGDGQFDVADIVPAITALQAAQADILFGSRFLQSNDTVPWVKRYIVRPIGRWIDRLFGAVNRSDTHNGFRVLSHQALDVIRIEQDRMAHATEIPQLVKTHQLSYIEFPVTVRYLEYGQSSLAGFNILTDLFMKRF